MDGIIPWDEWVGVILPFYPIGKRGHPPKGIEVILRMYLLQIWFNFSVEGMEDAIYDSYTMRKFVGISFLEPDVPDATTLLKFRRLPEQYGLNKLFFRCHQPGHGGNWAYAEGRHGRRRNSHQAVSSAKNADKQRGPEMRQTKKGNEWWFGVKCHIGVDAFSGLVHTIGFTPTNVHDVNVAPRLIREDDEIVYPDSRETLINSVY